MILVTGNEGAIGSRLVGRLLADGKPVRRFRDEGRWRDITRYEEVEEAVAGCDGIIHLAAALNYLTRDEGELFKVNVLGTEHLIRAARAHKVRDLVFASTQGVYESVARLGRRLRETDAMPPVRPYARSKWEAEQRLGEATDLRVTVFRLAGVYGPRMEPDNLVRGLLADAADGVITVLGNGSRKCDLVAVDDVAPMLIRGLGVPGTFNLGGGAALTVKDVAELIASLTNARVEYLTDRPEKPGWTLDSSKAMTELGYHPRPLADGLKELVWELTQH